MDSGNWIKLYRKIKESKVWFYTDSQFRVWVTILLSVNWNESWARFDGKEVKLQPGQMVTSIQHLSDESGVSSNIVRTTLNKLEDDEMVTRETTNQGTKLTVLNWHKYQVSGGTGDERNHERGDERSEERVGERSEERGEDTQRSKEVEEGEEETKEADASEESFNPGQKMGEIRSKLPDESVRSSDVLDAIQKAMGQLVFSDLSDRRKEWIFEHHQDALIAQLLDAENVTEVYQYKNQYLNSTIKPEMLEARLYKEDETQPDDNPVDDLIDATFGGGDSNNNSDSGMEASGPGEQLQELKDKFG